MIINKINGTILAIVAIKLMTEACFIPRKTRKLNPQIKIDPPIMDGILFPPVNVPGKK